MGRTTLRTFWFALFAICSFASVARAAGRADALTILRTGHHFDGARLAAVTDSLRREGRSLLVIHDGFMRWASVAQGRTALSTLHSAGVDVVTPTFLAFNLGPDELYRTFRRLPGPGLACANLQDARGNLLFPPYLVLQRNNVRIGFTTVMEPRNSSWSLRGSLRGESAWEFFIEDPERAVRSILPDLQEKTDVFVVYSPGGSAGLDKITGIDLLLTYRSWASEPASPRAPQATPPSTHPRVASESTRTEYKNRMDVPLRGRVRTPVLGFIPLQDIDESPWTSAETRRPAGRPRSDPSWTLSKFEVMESCCAEPESSGFRGNAFPTNDYDAIRLTKTERWVTHPGKRLDLRLTGHNYSVSLEWEHPYTDTIPAGPFDLYWRPPRLLEARIPPSFDLRQGWNGTIPSGSDLEGRVLTYLRGAADHVFSWEEQDSLARVSDLTKPESIPRERMESLTVLEQHIVHVLGLVKFLEIQAGSGLTETPQYWHRRGVVYVSLRIDPQGKVLEAELLENNAWPSAADSVLGLLRGWSVPTPSQTRVENVAVAVDRHESRLCLGGSVPKDLRQRVQQEAAAAWFQNLEAADSTVSFDDFIDVGPETLFTRLGKGVATEESRSRKRFGVLLPAPGKAWSLDVLPGGTLLKEGAMELSQNPGVRFWKDASAPHEWESPDQEVDLAFWLDDSRIAVLGWSAVDHPRISGKYVRFSVPTLWVLDLAARTSRQLQGPLLAPTAFHKARSGRDEVLKAAFPLLTWVN